MSYTYADFISALEYLEAEGYIKRFIDSDGSECVRISMSHFGRNSKYTIY